MVWARSSSSSLRYLPNESTGSPFSRSRGSPRVMIGLTLIAPSINCSSEQAFRVHIDGPRRARVAAEHIDRSVTAQDNVEAPAACASRDVGGQRSQNLD